MDIGKRIAELRTKQGYSQNRFADFAGISQSHLRRIELGLADITVGHLQMICDGLGITLSEFFGENTTKDDLSDVFSRLTPKQRQALSDFIKTI